MADSNVVSMEPSQDRARRLIDFALNEEDDKVRQALAIVRLIADKLAPGECVEPTRDLCDSIAYAAAGVVELLKDFDCVDNLVLRQRGEALLAKGVYEL